MNKFKNHKTNSKVEELLNPSFHDENLLICEYDLASQTTHEVQFYALLLPFIMLLAQDFYSSTFTSSYNYTL